MVQKITLTFAPLSHLVLEKVFGGLKKIAYLGNPFRKMPERAAGKKIFEKDLADSKIVLIFAIPFAI